MIPGVDLNKMLQGMIDKTLSLEDQFKVLAANLSDDDKKILLETKKNHLEAIGKSGGSEAMVKNAEVILKDLQNRFTK